MASFPRSGGTTPRYRPRPNSAPDRSVSGPRIRPWYEDTLEFDRERKEQIDTSIDARPRSLPAESAAPARRALPVA